MADKDAAPVKEKEAEPVAVAPPIAPTTVARFEVPAVITTAREFEQTYRYLQPRYHVLTPVTAFSGLAPQHGLVIAKVLIDSDPKHGEVYADPLFCKTKEEDPRDNEVALAKVALRKLALAGGWTLSADVLTAQRNYWLVRGYNRFVGLDGTVQMFTATEEYDLRDGSPQIRNMTPKQLESARAHGLRGGEARALNAACREYGIRQKYTRRELEKPFVVMRMMFIPDVGNEVQMRMVTERALQGTNTMYPQAGRPPLYQLDPMVEEPEPAAAAKPVEELPSVPDGMTLLRVVKEETRKKKPPKTGTFKKWVALDMHGVETVTIKADIGKVLLAAWNKDDWKKGRPLEIVTKQNAYNESEIVEVFAAPLEPDPADESQEPPAEPPADGGLFK